MLIYTVVEIYLYVDKTTVFESGPRYFGESFANVSGKPPDFSPYGLWQKDIIFPKI